MTIEEIIQLVENRIRYCEQVKMAAFNIGDTSELDRAEKELQETRETLLKINSALKARK